MPETSYQESPAVTNFRRYLRIPSVHPNINYDECVQFLTEMGREMSLPVNVIYVDVGKPVVIITMEGLEPTLPSVLLNSHMDVVPVFPEHWTYPPFGAEKDSNGNIYARGAQDTKGTGMQYIEAVRKYVREDLKLKRTIHICFVPDEEVGGQQGMAKFVHTEEFKNMNVGFALDEGGSSPTEEYTLDFAQRSEWEFIITCSGTGGHASIMHDDTAAEKLHYVLGKFLEYRAQQKQKLTENCCTQGYVTSVNVTMFSGGLQANVVPDELTMTFDVRVGVETDHNELEATFQKWCSEAGDGIILQYKKKDPHSQITKIDESNPWWMAFKEECDKMGLKLKPQICPAATDGQYLRQVGIPTLGFAPMNNTPFLFHCNDEFLNEGIFLRGIEIYYNIIKSLASL